MKIDTVLFCISLALLTTNVQTAVSGEYNLVVASSNSSTQCQQLCFCQNDVFDCNSTHPTVLTKKGEKFALSVAVVDQVGKPVNATIITSLKLDPGEIGSLKGGQQKRQVDDRCTELEYTIYSSNDYRAVMEINADKSTFMKEVNVTFLPFTCPIGLEPHSRVIDYTCVCDKQIKQYVSKCSLENGTWSIEMNSELFYKWIKYSYANITKSWFLIAASCPYEYCQKRPLNISLVGLIETDEQCAYNRSGVLCGGCPQGLSLVFGSSKCVQCSNYYLLLIVPFALAGIVLVAFILLTNMTVATGTIHGLIFYANIVAVNHTFFFPFKNPNFLTVFISWLNLDLGIETCFYDGMDSYGKLMLQLVFPVYIFLLILAFMVLHDRSQKVARIIGKMNPEATLYTHILLSYSKLIRIIIAALQNANFAYPDGSHKFVWFYDGNVSYFAFSHIPRFLAAFIITLFAAVYIVMLSCGQVFSRYSKYKLFKWTTHKYCIHFMNAHHAPLNNDHRYWVGLLLLVKLVYFLLSTLFYANIETVGIFSACLAFIMLLFKLLNRAYIKSFTNYLEALFFINLLVISIIVANSRTLISKDNHFILAYLSMSIVFVSFIVMTVLHTCGKSLSKTYATIRMQFANRISQQEEREHLVEDVNNDTPDDQLREPALDILIPVQPEDYNTPSLPSPTIQTRQMTTFVDIR